MESENTKKITFEVKIPNEGNMMDAEDAIEQALNQAKLIAAQYAANSGTDTDKKKKK